jgi:hypothetical protein
MDKLIKKEMADKAKAKREQILASIERELPPVVFRNWHKWRDILPMAPRTVANDDALGKGPANKVYVGRNAGYPRAEFLDYLKKRIRISEGE